MNEKEIVKHARCLLFSVFHVVNVVALCFLSRDGKALERFLQDYFDGNLKRYLKSEPIPENNDGPVKVRMRNGLRLITL